MQPFTPPPFKLGYRAPLAPRVAQDRLAVAEVAPVVAQVVVPCQNGRLRICVWEDALQTRQVGGARIEVSGMGNVGPSNVFIPTDVVVTGRRRYSVRASKLFHLPEPFSEVRDIDVDSGASVDVNLVLTPIGFHLQVDADRDGVADNDFDVYDRWQFGHGGRGAILLVNNDNDDGNGAHGDLDLNDRVINAGNDHQEVAPIRIRRRGVFHEANWTVELSIPGTVQKRVRIFAGNAAAAAEVIGPGGNTAVRLPNRHQDLAFATLDWSAEARYYRHDGFDGIIRLQLYVEKPSAYVGMRPDWHREHAQLRVAPWLMYHHLDPPIRVMVKDLGNSPALAADDGNHTNSVFRADLTGAIPGGGPALVELGGYGRDRWLQDCMEIGYSGLPNRRISAVLRLPRDGALRRYPRDLLDADFGYEPVGDPHHDTTFNSGGNLECTPPCRAPSRRVRRTVRHRSRKRYGPRFVYRDVWRTVPGRAYPFGRIYFGCGRPHEWMSGDMRGLLEHQIVQPHIHLDSGWLKVGHVDEMLSFIPRPGGRYQDFALVIASPSRAYELLDWLDGNGHHNARMLIGRQLPIWDHHARQRTDRNVEVTVRDFLRQGIPHVGDHGDLRAWNNTCQRHLDDVLRALRREIDIPQVIRAPVLFRRELEFNLYRALTADTANMLVVGQRCIAPRPYGPSVNYQHGVVDAFEHDLERALPMGSTIRFVRDWNPYHCKNGEVHCGTNTHRQPAMGTDPWWFFE